MSGPNTEALVDVARAVRSAPHGEKGPIYQQWAQRLGISEATLKAHVGRLNGRQRKRRADAGEYTLTRDEAQLLSAYMTESYRNTSKRLLSLDDAVDQLRAVGRITAGRLDTDTGELNILSTSQIGRALRGYGLHPDQLREPAPYTKLRSDHPNHVWQIDPSLCVLYYLKPGADQASGLQVMDADRFYKNKPGNIAKVEQQRVWRYVITDHASGAIFVQYVLGAESGQNLAHSFIECTQQRDGQPFYGVPSIAMMDPGSANTGAVFKHLAKALQVHVQINKPGNPRAKGQVEQANNLVERQFESGLRFVNVADLDQLNAACRRWTAWFNATKKHSRHGLTRYAAWSLITAAQLRTAPAPEICRELANTKPENRTVTPALTISFKGRTYSVDTIPGVLVGGKLEICTNPWREHGAQAVILDDLGRETFHPLEEETTEGPFAFSTGAATIGEEYKARQKTNAQRAAEANEALATGTTSQEEQAAFRKGKQLPFGGEINPYQQADDHTPVTWLPKRGTAVDVPRVEIQERRLGVMQAAKLLRDRLGDRWSADRMAELRSRYQDGLTETEIDTLTEQWAAAPATLKVVK